MATAWKPERLGGPPSQAPTPDLAERLGKLIVAGLGDVLLRKLTPAALGAARNPTPPAVPTVPKPEAPPTPEQASAETSKNTGEKAGNEVPPHMAEVKALAAQLAQVTYRLYLAKSLGAAVQHLWQGRPGAAFAAALPHVLGAAKPSADNPEALEKAGKSPVFKVLSELVGGRLDALHGKGESPLAVRLFLATQRQKEEKRAAREGKEKPAEGAAPPPDVGGQKPPSAAAPVAPGRAPSPPVVPGKGEGHPARPDAAQTILEVSAAGETGADVPSGMFPAGVDPHSPEGQKHAEAQARGARQFIKAYPHLKGRLTKAQRFFLDTWPKLSAARQSGQAAQTIANAGQSTIVMPPAAGGAGTGAGSGGGAAAAAAAGAGGAGGSAGAAPGAGGLGGMAGAAGFAVGAIAPPLLLLGSAALLAKEFIHLIQVVRGFGREMIDQAHNLSQASPAMAQVSAVADVRQTMRDFRQGQRLGPSAMDFNQAHQDLEDAISGSFGALEDSFTGLKYRIAAKFDRFVKGQLEGALLPTIKDGKIAPMEGTSIPDLIKKACGLLDGILTTQKDDAEAKEAEHLGTVAARMEEEAKWKREWNMPGFRQLSGHEGRRRRAGLDGPVSGGGDF